MEKTTKGTRSSKKTFAMNDDDHGLDLDDLETLGIGQVEQLMDPLPEGDPPGLSVQVEQVVQGLSGAVPGGQVYLVDVRQLDPYPDQPFHPYPQERLQELADDISRVGILSPILTRRQGNRLQILAGHNRWRAARMAGQTQVPVMVLEADDDRAALILTGTNLRQREHLLPSEKAFAYRMQMEALKRQGQKNPGGYDASSLLTRQTGDSRMQIHRYIRLTHLEPGLLALLDRGKISMTPAVSASYLSQEDQEILLGLIREKGASLTMDRASALKEAAETGGGELGRDRMEEILLGFGREAGGKGGGYVRIKLEKIRKFLPQNADSGEAEALIVKALEFYRRNHEEDNRLS